MSSLSSPMHTQLYSNPHPTHIKYHLIPTKTLKFHSFNKSISTNKPYRRLVPRGFGATSDDGDHDRRPPDVAERLYSKIVNAGLDELSGSLGNEGRYFRKLLTISNFFQGKKMFSSLMAFMVDHIEFVIKPTSRGGADLGLKWHFEWKDSYMPFGKDCGLHTSHVYYGRLLLRNGKQMMPLLPMEPLRLKLEQIVMQMLEKIAPQSALKGKRRVAFMYCMLILVVMAVSLILLKNTSV